MADVVQFRLERMADELDDLERRGLFSRAEIAELVRRRRDFEYRLKRPAPLKHDFLAYVDYETHFDALRDLRKRAIIGRLREVDDEPAAAEAEDADDGGGGEKKKKKKRKSRDKKWKKSISDVAGVMRILDIYRLAVMRYKGDLELWFRYLEFCREKRHGRMKQVLAQAIRYHPKVPGLWIYAAAWEFDQNLNVAAARALMQSGLRACPKSEDLWIEYLRMELTYLNKLKARKLALGENVRLLSRDNEENEQWKEENKDLFVSLNDEVEEAKESDQQEGALEKKEDLFWQHGSKILQTIYDGAVWALPSSMSLRKRFLEILDDVDLAHSEGLKQDILEGLKKDFSQDERYWDWLARLQINDTRKRNNLSREEILYRLNKAVEVYEESLKFLPSVEMFSLYTKFLLDVIIPDQEDTSSVLSNVAFDAADFTSRLVKVYERAEVSGCLTEDLAYQYISFYIQIGRSEEARNLAEKLCNGILPNAAKLWNLRASIEIKWLTNKVSSESKDDLDSVLKLLRNALIRLPISKAECLWFMAIKLFSNKKKHFLKLVQSLIVALGKASDNGSGYSIACAVINWVLQKDGIQHARQTYKKFLALPRPSLAFFRHCIELESNLVFVGEVDGVVTVRKLYESALSVYDQNKELWRDYYIMETKLGTSGTANAVYWRARKVLKDTSGIL